ncbi:MAG: tetratricopeptide repeat protein [Lentisphaeria bacterium]|nr:tetratricopeptide repeat protein [Lentisphaeria bacterium]
MRFLFLLLTLLSLPAFPGRAQDTPPPGPPVSSAAAGKRLTFAQGLLSRNFYQLAEKEFRLFLQDFPRDDLAPRAFLGLAKALQGQDENARALTTLEELERRWPGHAVLDETRLDRGYLLLRLNRPEEAEAILTPVTKDARSEVREAAWYFIAQSREARNDSQSAMKIYLSLASRPFDAIHSYRPYAAFAVLTSEVKTSLEQAVTRMETLLAGEHVPEAIQEQALQLCAVSAYSAGHVTRAGELYEKHTELFPDSAFAMDARKGKLRALYHYASSEDILSWIEVLKQIPALADDPEVTLIQAAVLLRGNRHEASLPLLQTVCDHPLSSEDMIRQSALMRLGALISLEKYETALHDSRAFHKKYDQHPETSEAIRLAGVAAFKLGQYQEAGPLLRGAADAQNMSPEKRRQARLLLAECYRNQEKFAASAAVYRELAGAPPYDETRAAERLYAASMEEKAGDLETALADYEAVISGTDTDTSGNLMAANAVVRLSFAMGNFDKTAALLNQLITKTAGETQARARLTLILAYLHADKLDACEEEIQKAEKSQPAGNLRVELDYAVARLAIKQKNMDRAVEVFKKLVNLPDDEQPDYDPGTLAGLEKEFFNRNDFATSEKICEKWLAAAPPSARFEPVVRLADIYLATARFEAAEAALRKLSAESAEFTLTPGQSARVLSLTGEALLKRGQDDHAFRVFEKSLEDGAADAETSARSHWGLALLLKRANRLDEALKRAVGGFVLGDDPRYTPRSMALAAEIFETQGKTREAANTRAELKTRFPDFVP